MASVKDKNCVLFSAVGASDPLRGDMDGPMLHIIRHYRPRKVYLFLTAEMSKKDQDLNLYEEAIHFLDPNCEVEKFYTGIDNAHNFDVFYEPFNQFITKISEENPVETILLNVTSGTPQIQSSMCLEVVSNGRLLIPVQVDSLTDGASKGIKHHDFNSLEELYATLRNSKDNIKEAKNRCSEPKIISFKRNIVKNQIKALIFNYDYQAAFHLISENKDFFTDSVKKYSEHAYYRSMPNDKKARKIAGDMDAIKELYPGNEEISEVFEYYSITKIKSIRGEISDFLLRLKPLSENLAEKFLQQNKTGWRTMAKKPENWRDEWYIDERLAEANHPGLIEYLRKKYKKNFDLKKSINNLSAMSRIMRFKQLDKEIVDVFGVFNRFIKKRNDLAHSLESATEEDLQNKLKTSSKELCELFEKLIRKIYKNPPHFDIYEQINRRILEEMDR